MGEAYWAAELAGGWVLHVPTRVIGKVKRYYDGTISRYVSSVNQKEVPDPVLEFADGNALLAADARREEFVALTQDEGDYYEELGKTLAVAAREMVVLGAKQGVSPATINVLLISALRRQADLLQRGHEVLQQAIKEAT